MTSLRHNWQDDASCHRLDVELFFDKYEEPVYDRRQQVDLLCRSCPVMRTCFAYAKFYKLTGVWGGVYMTDGKIDDMFNEHKTPDNWAETYTALIK